MIFELLRPGAENKTTAVELMNATGLKRRELMRQIRKERLDGKPILAVKTDGGGFFLPSTDGEWQAYYTATRREALAYLTMLGKIRKAISETEVTRDA